MWRDDAHLLDMLIYARKAMMMNAGKDLNAFLADQTLQFATLHVLQIVGESASKVSIECRRLHPEIA